MKVTYFKTDSEVLKKYSEYEQHTYGNMMYQMIDHPTFTVIRCEECNQEIWIHGSMQLEAYCTSCGAFHYSDTD